LRRILGLIALLVSFALAAPGAQAAPELGVNLAGNWFSSDAQFNALAQTGSKWARVFVFRDQVEQSPGSLNGPLITAYRAGFARMASLGVKPLVEVVGTPSWESGSPDNLVPPNPAGYANFARALSAAFGGSVGAYEVWNEEDAPLWWRGAPDAPAYAALLKVAYPAFKSGSPNAPVLLGGLTGNNSQFLSAVLDNGAAGSFDGVAVHADTACNLNSPYYYQKDNGGIITFSSFLGYKELLKVLAAHGVKTASSRDVAGQVKIWFDEIGWAVDQALNGVAPGSHVGNNRATTRDLPCDQGVWANQKAGGVSEDQQALYLAQAYHCIANDPNIAAALWFSFQDLSPDNTPNNRFGLITSDGTQRKAFATFAGLTRNGDQLTNDQCGNFDGPKISVLELGDPQGKNLTSGKYHKKLHVKVEADDAATVGRITLLLDGHKVRNFTKPQGPSMTGTIDINSAKNLANGPHKLTIIAKNMAGNITQVDVTVTKV
jgi:hypothetical protein